MNKVKYSSFKDAILSVQPILDKPGNSWFGRKVYLGYSSQGGWKVYELGLFARFIRYFKIGYKDTHLKHVVTNLNELTKSDALSISKQLMDKMPALRKNLKEIYNQKFQIVEVLPGKQNATPKNELDLTKKTKALPVKKNSKPKTEEEVIQPSNPQFIPVKEAVSLPKDPEQIVIKVEELKKESPPIKFEAEMISPVLGNQIPVEPIPPKVLLPVVQAPKVDMDLIPLATHPLNLKNCGNSCYLDCVLELLLSQDFIRQQILQEKKNLSELNQKVAGELMKKDIPVKQSQEIKRRQMKVLKKKLVLDRLVDLMQLSNKGMVGIKVSEIRKAIFQSELHEDFHQGKFKAGKREPSTIDLQHDAAGILSVLMNDLLHNFYETKKTDTIEGGKKFDQLTQSNGTMFVEIHQGKNSLEELIVKQFSETPSDEPRKFMIDGMEKKLNYLSLNQLLTMPEMMGMQIVRNGYDPKKLSHKIEDKVILPKSGILDFSPYYAGKQKESGKYEIVGYVVHEGNSLVNGHYTSSVKIGDKFYHCNDITGTYIEITKEAFYSNPNAYLLLLKKISFEQAIAKTAEVEKSNILLSEESEPAKNEKQQSSSLKQKSVVVAEKTATKTNTATTVDSKKVGNSQPVVEESFDPYRDNPILEMIHNNLFGF